LPPQRQQQQQQLVHALLWQLQLLRLVLLCHCQLISSSSSISDSHWTFAEHQTIQLLLAGSP
jgi:hypothetical protein